MTVAITTLPGVGHAPPAGAPVTSPLPLTERVIQAGAAAIDWAEARRDVCFDLVRVYLGIGLFAKGVQFVGEGSYLVELLTRAGQVSFSESFLLHYIPFAHLGGGALLALGLMTRLSAAAQIPILFGAVFFVHLQEGVFAPNQGFELSALVLFLLALFVVHGGGRWSLDGYLKRS